MNEERYRVMSIAQMLDKAIYLHKKTIGTSALYLFVMSILIAVVGIIFSFIIILPFSVLMTRNIFLGYGTFESGYSMSILMLTLIIVALFYSLESIKQSGIITIGSKEFLGNKVDISDAIMSAFKNILRVLSVIIAGVILFLPVFLVYGWIIISILSDYRYGLSLSNPGIILVSIIFMIAFIYFLTIHAFSIQVAILEKNYFFKALKRSRALVKGRFWKIFGCFISSSLTLAFINISIYAIFALIGGIIYAVLGSSNIQSEVMATLLMIGNIVRIPLQMLVSYFVSPISGIFATILYYNTRFKKEGYDIELNILRIKDEQ
ncbi:glycerophosphoryl diester phosphodiesterase membrane domain-containing protein [Proteiniborus sp.]|uniref:glycerophosphoryl diester phosphodiesterase membrane domain-containing protein n=1 Tax=Proteiniborus sp. TaxID=2079015 RepID=UPI0033293AE0